ncbi:MAG: proline dehydrogenase [Cytophagales bacterium]|nr:proline dehydrogenase [Cytophagales bacterium]
MQKQTIQLDNTKVAFASKSDEDLKKSRLVFSTMQYTWLVQIGMKLTSWALKVGLPIKGLIKRTLFYQFCGGESISDCEKKVEELGGYRVRTILDYSVEGESNEVSFDRTCKEIVEVCKAAKEDKNIPFSVVKPTGIGPLDVMTRVQAGETITEIEKSKLSYFQERAEEITIAAKASGIMFMIDAEETCMQDVVDEVTYELMSKYNKDYALVYNTYQLYRKDSLLKLMDAAARAKEEGFHFGAKLVRGAYMERERARAEEMGYEDPIQADKESTDRDYDAALEFCIKNIDNIGLCAGTHNELSNAYLVELMDKYNVKKNDPRVFFSQLLGMSDHISFNLVDAGYNVAKYVPYGPIEKVMPYLFRRAEENTAMKGQGSRELTLVKKELKRRWASN